MRRYTLAGAKRRLGRYANAVGRRWAPLTAAPTIEPYPAGFTRWQERRAFKLKAAYPDAWAAIDEPIGDRPRLAVVIHVHFPELLDELLDRLAHVPVPFDLLITTTQPEMTVDPTRVPGVVSMRVLPVPNRGRDILPLVSLVNAGLLDDYELVLKVHTKRSTWRADHPELAGTGDEWRTALVDELIGGEERVSTILAAFASDPSLGLVTAPGNIVGPEFWGGDEPAARDLLRRIQLGLDPEALRFAAGSMYWIRAFVLQGLRSFDLSPEDFEEEALQSDGTTAHALERIIGIVATEAGYQLRDTAALPPGDATAAASWAGPRPRPRARVVPFYLPQFHTFPENDRWWGRGFTEWSNVVGAKPVYAGHEQPLLPSELGFYDLNDDTVRDRQAALAADAGLAGVMYYHYWFAGRTLMTMPIERHHAGDASLPFCIMWANENWTRTWDGSEEDVLLGQDYDRAPAASFIENVLPFMHDPRYLRISDKPVLAVYRIAQLPDYLEAVAAWRAAAVADGLPGLTVLTVDVGGAMQGIEGDARTYGLDGALEFAPHNKLWEAQPGFLLEVDSRFRGRLMSYAAMARDAELTLAGGAPDGLYPGVMVSFDNTARRQWNPDLWYGSNPYTFRRWLHAAVLSVAARPFDERVVFVNAWNEWAESAVLEPTRRHGRGFLLAARDALHA